MRRSQLWIAGLALALSFGAGAAEPESLRTELLKIVNTPHLQQLRTLGRTKSARDEDFYQYFEKHLFVTLQDIQANRVRLNAQTALLQLGLAEDEAEYNRWEQTRALLVQQAAMFRADPEWTATLKEADFLARKVDGDIAEYVRGLYHERVRNAFAPFRHDQVAAVARLSNEVHEAQMKAPASDTIQEFMARIEESASAFKSGKISFAEMKALDENTRQELGMHVIGHQAVSNVQHQLNLMARMRSQLARTKGFANWGRLTFEHAADGYSTDWRKLETHKAFLRDLLNKITPIYHEILRSRFAQWNLPDEEMRSQYAQNLLPSGLATLAPRFPAKNLERSWLDLLMESGFDADVLDQMWMDIEPTPWIAAPQLLEIVQPMAPAQTVDLTTMNFIAMPTRGNRAGFMALTTAGARGADALRQLIHETGHALAMLTQNKNNYAPVAAATVEVPAMTFEYLLRDPRVLVDHAEPIAGKRMKFDTAQKAVDAQELADLRALVNSARNSLFELELWDYDFDAHHAQDFLERVEFVARDVGLFEGDGPAVPSKYPLWYSLLATSHYIGGTMRLSGHTLALTGTALTREFVSRQLLEESERATWNDQPGLAAILRDQVFTQLWKKPFPENIEAITGRKFDAAVLLDHARRLADRERDCAAELSAKSTSRANSANR